METLYNFEGDKVSYWEAWEADNEIIIHWGELGDRGETQTLSLKHGQSSKKFIAQETKKYRAESYRE